MRTHEDVVDELVQLRVLQGEASEDGSEMHREVGDLREEQAVCAGIIESEEGRGTH